MKTDRAQELEKKLLDLSHTDYALSRKQIAKEFEVPATHLDEIFKLVHPKKADPEPSTDEEVWPDPVDGNALLNELQRSLGKFVIADPSALVAIAAWIVHAHAHEAFNVSPILLISSPVKGCGKSTLLDVMEILVPRALLSANTTAAALYRSTENRPTIIVDEADLFFNDDHKLAIFFNAGHRRGFPFRRCEGADNHIVTFDSWTPKVMAQIGMPNLPQIVERSIIVQLRRKYPYEQVERFRRSRCHADLRDLRQMAARWAADNLDVLRNADPPMPSALYNRPLDNWEPLFAVAHAIGGDWPAKLEKAARDLRHDDNDGLIELLRDLLTICLESDSAFISTEEILGALRRLTERPYMTINGGREVNAHWLARQLKPFGLRSQQARPSNGFGAEVRGYYVAPIKEVCACYRGSTEASEANGASGADASVASLASVRSSEADTDPEDDEE